MNASSMRHNEIENLFVEACKAYEEKQYDTASNSFSSIVDHPLFTRNNVSPNDLNLFLLSFVHLGKIAIEQYKIKEGYHYFKKACDLNSLTIEQMSKETRSALLLSFSCIGADFENNQDFSQAIHYYQKAIEIAHGFSLLTSSDIELLLNCYLSLASHYLREQQQDLAYAYFFAAMTDGLPYFDTISSQAKDQVLYSTYHVGKLADNQKDYASALDSYEKVISVVNELFYDLSSYAKQLFLRCSLQAGIYAQKLDQGKKARDFWDDALHLGAPFFNELSVEARYCIKSCENHLNLYEASLIKPKRKYLRRSSDKK